MNYIHSLGPVILVPLPLILKNILFLCLGIELVILAFVIKCCIE